MALLTSETQDNGHVSCNPHQAIRTLQKCFTFLENYIPFESFLNLAATIGLQSVFFPTDWHFPNMIAVSTENLTQNEFGKFEFCLYHCISDGQPEAQATHVANPWPTRSFPWSSGSGCSMKRLTAISTLFSENEGQRGRRRMLIGA